MLQAVTHRMIRVWMGELLDGGAGNRSVTRKVASLSAYFRYLRKSGLATQNPVTKVKTLPNSKKKLPSFLKHDSIGQLFEGIEFGADFEGTRDCAVLELLYSCGLRRSELVGLQFLRDIDFLNATVKVIGKGRKERVVPLGDVHQKQ